jgi:hypothetical protein
MINASQAPEKNALEKIIDKEIQDARFYMENPKNFEYFAEKVSQALLTEIDLEVTILANTSQMSEWKTIDKVRKILQSFRGASEEKIHNSTKNDSEDFVTAPSKEKVLE